MKKTIWVFFLGFSLSTCGGNSNYLAYLTPDKDRDVFDVHLHLAQAYYNKQDLKNAISHGEKALKLNPNSEDAAIILGFIYLAKAGLDPYDLAIRMNSSSSKSSASTTSKNSSSNTSSGNSDSLSSLDGIVNLSSDDFKKLGNKNFDDPTLPVIIPVCAQQARNTIEKLGYVNKAISAICRFEIQNVRIENDIRHSCQYPIGQLKKQGDVLFLWAFAHLTEAIIFHSVIAYSTTKSSETNLQLRTDKVNSLKTNNPTQIPVYIDKLDSLSKIMNSVFPLNDTCTIEFPQTQLIAMMNDMLAAENAFSAMPGVPASMTASLHNSLKSIQALRKKPVGDTSQAQTQTLKGNFTKGITQSISNKINSTDTSKFTAAQIAQVCNIYGNISGSIPKDPNKPIICSTVNPQ